MSKNIKIKYGLAPFKEKTGYYNIEDYYGVWEQWQPNSKKDKKNGRFHLDYNYFISVAEGNGIMSHYELDGYDYNVLTIGDTVVGELIDSKKNINHKGSGEKDKSFYVSGKGIIKFKPFEVEYDVEIPDTSERLQIDWSQEEAGEWDCSFLIKSKYNKKYKQNFIFSIGVWVVTKNKKYSSYQDLSPKKPISVEKFSKLQEKYLSKLENFHRDKIVEK